METDKNASGRLLDILCLTVLLIYFMFFRTQFRAVVYYNLVLFKIKRFYIYRDIVGTEAFLLNTAGNVVCFMPV